MTFNSVLALILASVLSNNCVVANCTAIDLTTTKHSSIKNASIYSLIVFCISVVVCCIMGLVNSVLYYYGLTHLNFMFVLVVSALVVQMAEYIVKRVCPLFYAHTKHFLPILATTLFVLIGGAYYSNVSFVQILLTTIFECIGLWIVLCLIAGVRKNCIVNKSTEATSGTIMSLIIVLTLMLIWTAF